MVVPFASASRVAAGSLSATRGITEWWSFLLRPHHARPLEAWAWLEVSFSYGPPLCVRISGRTRLFTFYGSQVRFVPLHLCKVTTSEFAFFFRKKSISVAYLNLTSNKVKYMTPFGLCYDTRVPIGTRVMRTQRERPWLGMLWQTFMTWKWLLRSRTARAYCGRKRDDHVTYEKSKKKTPRGREGFPC